MTKLSDAVALLNAAPCKVEWDTSGECIVVRTVYLEKDGTTAGAIERNFNDDQPKPPAEEPAEQASAGVTVALTGVEATATGAQL